MDNDDRIERLRQIARLVAKATGWELRVESRGVLSPVLWAKSSFSGLAGSRFQSSIELRIGLEDEDYGVADVKKLMLKALEHAQAFHRSSLGLA